MLANDRSCSLLTTHFTNCNKTHFFAFFGFIRYVAGGFDGFRSCFIGVFCFVFGADDDTIWSGWARKTKQEQNKQLYALLGRTDAVRSRMKAKREENRSAQLLYPNRKETVR